MSGLLVLRPEPGASETVERARQCGLDALAVPLFVIEPVDWELPDTGRFDALLLTSANAVRCGGEPLKGLRRLPVHAVGAATAAAAGAAGFDIASIGESNVERLLQSMDPKLKLLHPCGEHRTALTGATQQVTPLIVYRARELRDADVRGAEGRIVLVHSPRAGRRFAELADAASLDRRTIAVAAISAAALDACGGGWRQAAHADEPTDDALLALAATLCNKPGPG
jgi:uroporphyrinogen-III synthase